MRLLLLTLDFPPQTGGVARYLDALATYYRDEITVIAPFIEGATLSDTSRPYPVIREIFFTSFWPRWLPVIGILTRRKAEYDTVIVSHVLPVGTAAMIASWLTRRPYAVIVHGLDVVLARKHVLKRWLTRAVLRRAKVVVTNSRALEKEVRKDFGVEKTVVVYPVVSNVTSGVAKNFGNTIKLLTISRLVPRKGHLRVLDALALLRERGHLKGLTYEIVGDGPMEQEIRDRVSALGLGDIVTMRQHVGDEQLASIYTSADVFVMPTVDDPNDREGFGTVYIEAAACGVPSIATNVPGVDEAVVDWETGVLVADGDIRALADAIERLRSDPNTRARLGAAAQNRVRSEFVADKQFSKLRSAL